MRRRPLVVPLLLLTAVLASCGPGETVASTPLVAETAATAPPSTITTEPTTTSPPPTSPPATSPPATAPPATSPPATPATTPRPPPVVATPAATVPPAVVDEPAVSGACDPSYPGVCIPPGPPDLDCPDIAFRRFAVVGADAHRFDADADGIGCESG